MKIDAISSLNIPQIQQTTNTQNTDSVDFGKILSDQIDKINDSQINAENSTISLMTGDATDIHQVLLDTEEAKLSLELGIQIRNKLVDAYQEISRIQI